MNDHSPEKWVYKEHTRVKHELLRKYLGGWLSILGSAHSRLLIFDGFAGRGTYEKGEEGSPLIIVRTAADILAKGRGRIDKVICFFVERDPKNFEQLKSTLGDAKNTYPQVDVMGPRNDDFVTVVQEIMDITKGKLIPSFFFIDPFGFTGMPFEPLFPG